MNAIKRLWTLGWTVGIAAGFAGLGVLGLGLMAAAIVYPTGFFWGPIVFVLGLLAILAFLGWGMTVRPRTRDGTQRPSG